MKITKTDNNYFLENNYGSYHFSHSRFEELGEVEAVKYAEREIRKKSETYLDRDIDFQRARSSGFCEYGIKDFCEELGLDITKTYTLNHLKKVLIIEVLLSYPDECVKLFGESVVDAFGGAYKLLDENRSGDALNFILKHYLSDNDCHELGCVFARACLNNIERVYPKDNRPRLAIEAKLKLKWLKGEISNDELLSEAWVTRSADSAAYSAADLAVWVARSTYSATLAAYSATDSADSATLAAYSAVLDFQIDETLKRLQ